MFKFIYNFNIFKDHYINNHIYFKKIIIKTQCQSIKYIFLFVVYFCLMY